MSARGPLRGHDTLEITALLVNCCIKLPVSRQQGTHTTINSISCGSAAPQGAHISAALLALQQDAQKKFHARTSAGERAAVPSCAVLARERLRARGRLRARCHSGCCRRRDVLILVSSCAPANTNTNTNTKNTCDTGQTLGHTARACRVSGTTRMCPRAPVSLSPSAPALAPPLASDVLASAVSTRSPPLGGDSARVGSSAAVEPTPPSSATGGACSGAVGLPCRGDRRLSAPRNNSGQ